MNPNDLRIYEAPLSISAGPDRRFQAIFILSIIFFLGLGFYLKSMKLLPVIIDEVKVTRMKTQFVMAEKKKEAVKLPVIVPEPEAKKPIDLTDKPLLNQKENATEKQDESKKIVERVYGLRKVYSIGIGAGGSAEEAGIGKLGNTLNKEIDTLTATQEQLEGKVASVTTVTKMPVVKFQIKPEYTEEMKKNRIEGKMRAKILIGADGRVKQVELLNDLGFGSRESALASFKKMEFEPALQGDTPVAVWLTISVKFVLLE